MSLVPETGLGSAAPALSGDHYRVMDALRRVLGDAPADWFHDAVRLSVPWAAPTLRASSYVVALLLQQIEERLRTVLLPLDFVSRSEYELRQQEIEEIVCVYELAPDDLQRWQRCRLSLERTISESLPTQDASDLLGEHAALFFSTKRKTTSWRTRWARWRAL